MYFVSKSQTTTRLHTSIYTSIVLLLYIYIEIIILVAVLPLSYKFQCFSDSLLSIIKNRINVYKIKGKKKYKSKNKINAISMLKITRSHCSVRLQ